METKDKILIVEDDETIAAFLIAVLEANGFDTIRASLGREAVTLISSHCPDLVLLDLSLPLGIARRKLGCVLLQRAQLEQRLKETGNAGRHAGCTQLGWGGKLGDSALQRAQVARNLQRDQQQGS